MSSQHLRTIDDTDQTKEYEMQFDKQQILDLMQSQGEPGDPGKADQARDELPQQVDTDNPEHQSLLQRFGIDPQDLIGKLAGGAFGL